MEKKILTPEQKKANNLRYKLNYIKKHFGGDEDAYKLYLATKVRELYHNPDKSYKQVSDKRRSEAYYRKKENRMMEAQFQTVS